MQPFKTIEKRSLGMGDRVARQGKAQLQVSMHARDFRIQAATVWNKSNREHTIIGSEPVSTRTAADAAVKELGWNGAYFLDADHIRLETVERFLPHCEF